MIEHIQQGIITEDKYVPRFNWHIYFAKIEIERICNNSHIIKIIKTV